MPHREPRVTRSAGTTLIAGLTAAAVGVALVWTRRNLALVTVKGASMEPTLRAGDRVLVRRRDASRLRHGDIVVLDPPDVASPHSEVVRKPDGDRHVKRVAALPGDPMPPGVPLLPPTSAPDGRVPAGWLVVLSDNPIGRDSRAWGPYPTSGLIGVALLPTHARKRRVLS